MGKAFFSLPRRNVICNGKGVFVQLLERKHSANVPLILSTTHQQIVSCYFSNPNFNYSLPSRLDTSLLHFLFIYIFFDFASLLPASLKKDKAIFFLSESKTGILLLSSFFYLVILGGIQMFMTMQPALSR